MSAPGPQRRTSPKNDWRTPPWLFNWLNSIYRIDLDAAASPENALCERYLTEEDDALTCEWPGDSVAFCNPPYGNLGPWIKRFVFVANYRPIVAVLPAATDTAWFALCVRFATTITLLQGRVSFLDTDGRPVTGNTTGTAIVFFDPSAYGHGAAINHTRTSQILDRYV